MMYRLLIADDEPIERKAMRKMLTEGIADAEVAGEAANGNEAVRLAEELNPDIVLMDIKMPGMDGLEAVREIRKMRPDMKFIMVSAFDTFEYAREAMKEGVKEYLLKPSRKKEIIETVQRAVKEVRLEGEKHRERTVLEEKLDRALSLVRSEWVTSLLLDHVREIEDVEWRDFLELGEGTVYAVVCRLTFLETENEREMKNKVYAWLKKTFNGRADCLVGPMAGGQVPVFVTVRKDEETFRSHSVNLAKYILQEFDRVFTSTNIRIGIGGAVESISDFTRSYEEALTAIGQTNDNVRNIVYHPSLVHVPGIDKVRAEKQILDAVRDGDSDGAASAFQYYVKELDDDSELTRKHLQNLLFMAGKVAEEMGIFAEVDTPYPEGAGRRELIETARVKLMRVVDEVRIWQSERVHGLFQEAKQYIGEHYHEAMTLEDIAAQVELSPYYFSKLFKEQTGTTFIEYLTEVRIQCAKDLLKTTRLSLKEICFKAGYRDPNYFSRVFKKNTGRSPSDYRSALKEV